MKKILFVITLFACLHGYAQNQAANWFFGVGAGVNFDLATGVVTSVDGGQLNTREGCTSISNDSGDLVLYTDGSTVFNRNHQIMLNGENLFGDNSSTQSAIVVPAPKDPNIYYIFTVDTTINTATDPDNGFNYSVVDIALDGGLGGVTLKNSPLLEDSSEKITAVLKDCTTESIWVITFASETGSPGAFTSYHAFEVSEFGVNTTAVVSTFPPVPNDPRGQIKVSPDGTKFISANMLGGLFLFDFDTATGVVSNMQELFINSVSTFAYGVEFSPNSELLYIHSSNNQGANQPAIVHQSSLTQFNLVAADIQASEFRVDQRQLYRGSLQLGPNGKIYRTMSDNYFTGKEFLSVINNPNTLGDACDYQNNAINLFPNQSTQGLPPFIQSFFNDQIDIIQNNTSTTELLLCDGDSYTLMYDDIPDAVYTWYKDDVLLLESDFDLVITEGGTYKLVIVFNNGDCQTFEGTAHVEFFEAPIANSINDIIICDDDNDGFWNFDLAALDNSALGGQLPVDFTVSYHSTQADADDGINPLTSPYTNQIAFQDENIYVRVENNLNTPCYATTNFLINVFKTPSIIVSDYELCDDINDGDDTNGVITFDLQTKVSEILGTQLPADFEVKFYYNQAAADVAVVGTEITTPIQNTTNPQSIIARIENKLNVECYVTASFNLKVNPLPVVIPIVQLTQCDDDTDGFSDFNLTEANELISADYLNESYTYYLTQAEADGGLVADQIVNFINYPNPTALNSSIFVRVETSNNCYRTAKIDLVVGATQIPLGFNLTYEICDDKLVDADNTNGIAAFDFSDATAQVEALFPVGQSLTISYYTNEIDALAETNAIADISNHRNETSANVQQIFVRVDSNVVNACLGLGNHITLTVSPLPIANPITDYVLCSDTDFTTFDLTTKDAEALGTQTTAILISYHLSEQDAINNVQILNPGAYTNTNNPQTIYVRSQFDDNGNGVGDVDECYSTDMSFNLIVNHNPIIFAPDDIRICSDQILTLYDLTIRASQITGGDSSIVLAFYESQLDIDNSNPIANPTQYTNTVLDRDILVLATGTNLCTSTIILTLKTILYANLNRAPTDIEECEIDNNGFDFFDITRRELEILNGLDLADFTFTYYEVETDAIAGNSNIITNTGNFENTIAVTQTIFARVLPIDNECFIVVPITLIVNPVPEIDIEDKYVICLDSTNGVIDPVTQTFLPNPPIDTQLNEVEYTFQWYNGTELEVNTDPNSVIIAGATGSAYFPTQAGDYTVLATNLATGCRIPASTVVVGSYPPESITVELLSAAFSDNNIIEVSVVGIGEYEYRLDFGPWQSSNRFENLTGGEHEVYVRDLLNCNEISVIQIVIDYPKYFTPNGDGYHDTWNIKGIATQPNSKIYIYDRYGKLLKQLSPTNIGWDGTFNGNKLPSSDYWFTIEYVEPSDNVLKQFKAHFALKR